MLLKKGKVPFLMPKAAQIFGVILVESVVLMIYSFSSRRSSNNIFKNKQIINRNLLNFIVKTAKNAQNRKNRGF